MFSSYGLALLVLQLGAVTQVICLLDDIGALSPLAAVSGGNQNGITGLEQSTVGGNQVADVSAISTITKGKAAEAAAVVAAADEIAKSRRRPPLGEENDDPADEDEDDRQVLGSATGTGIRSNVKASLGTGGLLGGGGGGNVVSGLLGTLRPAATLRAATRVGV